MKFFLGAEAAVAAFSVGAVAQATTYDLGTLTVGGTNASTTVNHKNTTSGTTTFSDTFDFAVTGSVVEFTSAAVTERGSFAISDIDLTLYASGGGAPIATLMYDPQTSPSETLMADLTAGAYYLTSAITVPHKDTGSYTLAATVISAAPEPASWALMFVGVALTGGMLRFGRRYSAISA